MILFILVDDAFAFDHVAVCADKYGGFVAPKFITKLKCFIYTILHSVSTISGHLFTQTKLEI